MHTLIGVNYTHTIGKTLNYVSNLPLSAYSDTLINLMWLLLVTGEGIDIFTKY